MTRTDLQEATDLIAFICARLNALALSATSAAAADLRRATGAIVADAEYLIGSTTLSPRMLACFQLAASAGAGFSAFHAFRERVAAVRTDGRYARIVQQDASRRAIIQMAVCIAGTTFRSRDEVTTTQAQMNAVFAAAEEEASDALDTSTYRALVTLHAAVTRDLSTRARPLPRMITYAIGSPIPSLVLAQQLYGDAGRADELVAENAKAARAPLFMPLMGRALSA